MFKNWTFGRRIAAGFGLAGLVLLVIIGISYRATSGLIDNNASVTHTYLVREDLSRLIAQLTDAETGQRGYLITGEDDYLQP